MRSCTYWVTKSRLTVIGLALLPVAMALALIPTGPLAQAAGSTAQGSISACTLASASEASSTLQVPVTSVKQWKTGGFSECLYLTKSGKFLLLDLASSQMLNSHYGAGRTAAEEYQMIKRHGFPVPLRNIWRHTYLVNGSASAELQGEVVGLDTFGDLSKGATPMTGSTVRLSDFLNTVMGQFQ